MSKTRDYIAEIVAKQRRMRFSGTRLSLFSGRTNPICLFNPENIESKEIRDEILKYVPVGYVAATEAFFRLAIRDLIDFGPPFSENAKQFKDFKFPLETVLNLYQKGTTIGELVAHLLPINNLQDINSTMSVLLGEDFRARLKETKLKLKPSEDSSVTLKDFNDVVIFQDVEKIFSLRHYYCHEFAIDSEADEKQLNEMTGGVFLFVLATESLLNELKVFTPARS
jgi:hypothetical protein